VTNASLAFVSKSKSWPSPGPIYRLKKDYIYKVNLIKLLLMSENKTPLKESYNANLFYHSWIFNEDEFGENSKKYIKCKSSFIKNPYIGLFHPFGAIYTIENNATILNNLVKTSQNIHAPSDLSPCNSQIYIKQSEYGKAYSVCINYEKMIDCNATPINAEKIKGRIELLLFSPILLKINEFQFTGLTTSQFINRLSNIEELKVLLNTYELDSIKNETNNKIIQSVVGKEYTYWNPSSLVLFRYNTGKSYPYTLNFNLPIEPKNIPYIDEIKSKLPESIRDKIEWEFGCILASSMK
jgi:hypothetical protein